MADLQAIGCRLNWPIGYQVHIPLQHLQQRQRHSAMFPVQAPVEKPTLEPGRDPFPSGYILRGRRINRSVPGRPAVPKRHFCGGDTVPHHGRSRHQSPGGPSTRSEKPALVHPAPRGGSHLLESPQQQLGHRSLRESRADPSHTDVESKADPSHRHSHTPAAATNPFSNRTPQ